MIHYLDCRCAECRYKKGEIEIQLVTFATDDMAQSALLCERSAQKYGVTMGLISNPDSLMLCCPDFDLERASCNRGFGYWEWKSRLVDYVLQSDNPYVRLNDGDILIYADAGVEFINNVYHIIDRMDQDIFLFGNNWEHAHWCKRDIIEAVEPPTTTDNEPDSWVWTGYKKQAQASVIFFRVSDYTRKFVKEWLYWCLFEGGRLIDDSPSIAPNHPEFQENRHDQAILTTLAYREGIKLHWWPAIYNDGQFTYEKLPVYASDDYPAIFHHHRRRDVDWKQVA